MSNITTTHIDTAGVGIGATECNDELLYFAAADSFVAGTILARLAVHPTVTVTPGENTGTKALSVTTHAYRTLQVGTYTLTAGDLTAGVGPWTLVAPDGQSETHTTAGGTDADDLVFENLGLTVVVAASGTAFDDGDTATLVTTAGGYLVPYDADGSNGAQRACAVLGYLAEKSSSGTLAVRPIVKGKVVRARLIIDADGDGSNVTSHVTGQLQDHAITAVTTAQLSGYDNS